MGTVQELSKSMYQSPRVSRLLRLREMLLEYLGGDALVIVGLVLLAAVLFLALFGPLFSPANPLMPSADLFAPPSSSHPFGTDAFGRDMLARVIYAFRLDI